MFVFVLSRTASPVYSSTLKHCQVQEKNGFSSAFQSNHRFYNSSNIKASNNGLINQHLISFVQRQAKSETLQVVYVYVVIEYSKMYIRSDRLSNVIELSSERWLSSVSVKGEKCECLSVLETVIRDEELSRNHIVRIKDKKKKKLS